MRIVCIERDREEAEFARKAVEHFAADPRTFIYTEEDPAPGVLLAIRWNPFSVLVLRLDEDHVPAIYGTHQFIQQDFPPLQGEPQFEGSTKIRPIPTPKTKTVTAAKTKDTYTTNRS